MLPLMNFYIKIFASMDTFKCICVLAQDIPAHKLEICRIVFYKDTKEIL